jgi:hypothetical protein
VCAGRFWGAMTSSQQRDEMETRTAHVNASMLWARRRNLLWPHTWPLVHLGPPERQLPGATYDTRWSIAFLSSPAGQKSTEYECIIQLYYQFHSFLYD